MHAAWFMTSLTQTAGHKMAALTVVISKLSNVDLKTTTMNTTRNLFVNAVCEWNVTKTNSCAYFNVTGE